MSGRFLRPVITNLCTTPEGVRVEKTPDHHLSYEDDFSNAFNIGRKCNERVTFESYDRCLPGTFYGQNSVCFFLQV